MDARSQAEKRSFFHYVIPRFTRARLPAARKIQDIYAGIIKSEPRNRQILSDAVSLIGEGRTPLVLTERKEHAMLLADELRGKADHIFLLLGSGGQKEKRERLAALRSVPANESLAVVATGKYIGEGFDEPRLDTILLAMPVSWKGTLSQYAGRLHRNYEGKLEVRIYDYVDIHIPSLERMYHKRLKGYADLGYQMKPSEQALDASRIYDGQDYLMSFMSDLGDAGSEILLVSPFLNNSRVKAMLPILEKAIVSGTTVTIYTRTLEDCQPEQHDAVETIFSHLKKIGVTIETESGLLHRFAIIDRRIVWYGNIDFLSYSPKDANALRFESPEIAGELMDLRSGNLQIELSV